MYHWTWQTHTYVHLLISISISLPSYLSTLKLKIPTFLSGTYQVHSVYTYHITHFLTNFFWCDFSQSQCELRTTNGHHCKHSSNGCEKFAISSSRYTYWSRFGACVICWCGGCCCCYCCCCAVVDLSLLQSSTWFSWCPPSQKLLWQHVTKSSTFILAGKRRKNSTNTSSWFEKFEKLMDLSMHVTMETSRNSSNYLFMTNVNKYVLLLLQFRTSGHRTYITQHTYGILNNEHLKNATFVVSETNRKYQSQKRPLWSGWL